MVKFKTVFNKDGVGRTIEQHIEIYKNLEARKIIKTKKNGLGNKDLYDLIPFGSRHLPSFETSSLRAIDFSIKSKNNYLSGKEILIVFKILLILNYGIDI